ncbi:MAG: hypothetical protein Ta2B_13310 [Termitinemataceae bacterium]|nr:MAG: hypothetical protein Ta2B_13310 [Termitinemataceae bacterium]
MKPEQKSENLLRITRAKAKMLEFNVPEQYQDIDMKTNPNKLFPLTIGLLGDYVYAINQSDTSQEARISLQNNLRFASRFFDSYLQSDLDTTLDAYLIIIGSATYYLCAQPGNSMVLANKINGNCPDLETDGLSSLLLWLLQYPKTNIEIRSSINYEPFIIKDLFFNFMEHGEDTTGLVTIMKEFRKMTYDAGTARCLLFIDIISAVINQKINNSCWIKLPLYSDLPIDTWKPTIQKNSFIKELWPSQQLIGEKDVLKGQSAIIQMPTSAGKTKASEIIIRSSFLSGRTSFAIIIAPFRALCHEINADLSAAFRSEADIQVDELNDVLQMDIATEQLQGKKAILIVTPEKLLYVLNHNKEIAKLADLFIFDEGHQFDNGSRGITYELLLTTLLLLIPQNAQKILISAVIQNAKDISLWLNNNENVVSGTNLLSTFRTIGFTSWTLPLGQIKYVKDQDRASDDFFVPRMIEQVELKKLGRERIDRFFPEKDDSQSISLYLGQKIVSNGSIAIFCGKKDAVSSICKIAQNCIKRGVSFDKVVSNSDENEIARLALLYGNNLGFESPETSCAKNGIFAHTNTIPHGIRIAVEYAMRKSMVSFVICTSTLAQGVNLPIRYLIITGTKQGYDHIKNRDFHNLIGRAGRSGMYTEGSIIFADPAIYDGRNTYTENWDWYQAQNLLDPEKGEPCLSELVNIFKPLERSNKNPPLSLKTLKFVNSYLEHPNHIENLVKNILETQNQDNGFTEESLHKQFTEKSTLISAIENFFLSNWDDIELLKGQNEFSDIVTKTLGYTLANEEMKAQLSELFNAIEMFIRENITDSERRQVYGKTLKGIHEAQDIEAWYILNESTILTTQNETSLLDLLWNKILEILKEGYIGKLNNSENMRLVLDAWISGKSYSEILNIISENGITRKWGKSTPHKIVIYDVVNFCDNTFAFDVCLIINSILEFLNMKGDENVDVMLLFQSLQRRVKYGLPDEISIALYELGFCDRIISQDIKRTLAIEVSSKALLLHELRTKKEKAIEVVSKYPAYYQNKMQSILLP